MLVWHRRIPWYIPKRLQDWFQGHAERFCKRFESDALAIQCNKVVSSNDRSPAEIAEKLRKMNTEFHAYTVLGDVLFPANGFYAELYRELGDKAERLFPGFDKRPQVSDFVNGHDNFLCSKSKRNPDNHFRAKELGKGAFPH